MIYQDALSNKFKPLQRAYLDSSQKKKNGNMSAGTSGVNVNKKPVTQPQKPTVTGGGKANVQKPSTGAAMANHLGNVASGAGIGKSGGGNTGIGAIGTSVQAAIGANTQQPNSDHSDSDNYNGGGISSPFLNNPATKGQGSQQGSQPMTFSGDYMEEANKMMVQLGQIMTDGFKYDYKSDPAYLAAVAQAQEGAKAASDQTLVDMASRGILNSSVTGTQMDQIQQKAQQAPLQLIPGLEANAYGRWQNNISNQFNLMGAMRDEGHWQADQQWKEAETTGTWESPEYKQLFDSLMGAKEGYMAAKTAEERAAFAQQGTSARAALTALTGRTDIDKLFGSGVTADQARGNYGSGGIETMTAKRYKVEDTRYDAETKYNHDQDTKTWDFKDKEYNQRERLANAKGSGSGGPSASSINRLLDQNTSKMIYSMIKGGVTDEKTAMDWIGKHEGEVFSGMVKSDDLLNYFTKKGDAAAKDAPDGPTDYQLWNDAEDLAQKDPRVKAAETSAYAKPLTQDEYDAIVKEKYETLKKRAGGGGSSYAMTPEQQAANDLHKTKWLQSLPY